MPALSTALLYTTAALCEIAGCFAFWAWLRLGRSALWLLPGIGCLMAFAWLLTLVDQPAAGRVYAAYGGIYIAASLVWMRYAEGLSPDRYDLAGAGLALTGALVILLPAR